MVKNGDHFGNKISMSNRTALFSSRENVTSTVASITSPSSTQSVDEELESTIEHIFATPRQPTTSTEPTFMKLKDQVRPNLQDKSE